jgi:hypothetical protein
MSPAISPLSLVADVNIDLDEARRVDDAKYAPNVQDTGLICVNRTGRRGEA